MPSFTNPKTIVFSAVSALLALGYTSMTENAFASDFEKCAGIAAAGKNDCGTPVSSCAGTAKQDRDPYAWVLVPKGTCSKIAGGVVTTDPTNQHGGIGAKSSPRPGG